MYELQGPVSYSVVKLQDEQSLLQACGTPPKVLKKDKERLGRLGVICSPLVKQDGN